MGGTVTGNVIYNYFSHPCSFRVHQDLFGDRSRRSLPGPAGRYLMERGNRHEARVFDEIRREHPDDWEAIEVDSDAPDREQDFDRRFHATLDAMRRGVRYIFHGFLRDESGAIEEVLPGGETRDSKLVFRGETDILLRVDEPSGAFGAHSYVVGDVKSSRHARFAQMMQVAFYSTLLGTLQDRDPESGFVVTGAGERESFPIDELSWTLRHFLEEEVHEYADPDRVFYHVEPACSHCHWRDHCREKAAADDDLSLIPGCRRSEKRALTSAGIHSRRDLVSRDDAELRRLGRAHGSRLDGFRDLKQTASAQEIGRPVVRQAPSSSTPVKAGSWTAPDLFRHRGPLLLISSIPDTFNGDEAALVSLLLRREELASAESIEARLRTTNPDDPPGEMLRHLWSEVATADRLLKQRREKALVVFLDPGLPYRLKRQAEELNEGRLKATTWVDKLLADAVVLERIVQRTYFLPERYDGVARLAASLSRTEPRYAYASPLNEAAIDDHLKKRGAALSCESAAGGALQGLAAVAADYAFDLEKLRDERGELAAILVREWRDSADSAWLGLIDYELHESLRAGVALLRRLVEMAA